jgi:hypothetical protein
MLLALAATGFIWVRYSLVITPINYSLAAVRKLIVDVYKCPELTVPPGQLLRRPFWSITVGTYCAVCQSSVIQGITASDYLTSATATLNPNSRRNLLPNFFDTVTHFAYIPSQQAALQNIRVSTR